MDEDVAYLIGRAYVAFLKPKQIVIGGDMQLSTESMKQPDAGKKGLCGARVDAEEIYFATPHLQMDGDIIVTAINIREAILSMTQG